MANDLIIRMSERFIRAASMPITVIMRQEGDKIYELGTRQYYTRYHACPNKPYLGDRLIPDSPYNHDDSCYEFDGAYGLTWDEAIKDYYDRCVTSAQGTDLDHVEHVEERQRKENYAK